MAVSIKATIRLAKNFKLAVTSVPHSIRHRPAVGFCPICRKRTVFFETSAWLREDLKCLRCNSSARQRALVEYIELTFPRLGEMHVYEPSPFEPTTEYLKKNSAEYTWSYYLPDSKENCAKSALHQDLQSLTFADGSFDLVVSQDVFEHIANPRRAFREVSRILKSGGSHVFTIPWYPAQLSEARATMTDGAVTHLHPPEYHSDPGTDDGSLVFTRFGGDIEKMINESSGMLTSLVEREAPEKGIRGDSLQVFHSIKP